MRGEHARDVHDVKGHGEAKGERPLRGCVNGKSAVDATLCKRWRLVKKRQAKGKEFKAKKLSAEAAGMPDQPARSGPRVGEYSEGRVVDEWQSTGRGRDTMDQARQGGACV